MFTLTWSEVTSTGTVGLDDKIEEIYVKPDLGFEYTNIYLEDAFERSVIDGEQMEDGLIAIAKDFCINYQFTVVEEPIEEVVTVEEPLEVKMAKSASAFLRRTDWYAIREYERGIIMPEWVKIRRAQCTEYVEDCPKVEAVKTLASSDATIDEFLEGLIDLGVSQSLPTL